LFLLTVFVLFARLLTRRLHLELLLGLALLLQCLEFFLGFDKFPLHGEQLIREFFNARLKPDAKLLGLIFDLTYSGCVDSVHDFL